MRSPPVEVRESPSTQAGDGIQKATWLAALILLVPLAARAYVGHFAHYAGDDFCWPVALHARGFFGQQWFSYMHDYGRWASTFLLSLTPTPAVTTVLPAIVVALWVFALAWLCYEISHLVTLAIVIAEVLVTAILAATPGKGLEALYWQSGLLTYLPPLVLAPLMTAAVLRTRSPALAGVAAFVLTGFNESFMAVETTVLVAALLLYRGPYKPVVVAAFAGALIGTLVVLISPGNSIRSEAVDHLALPLVPLATIASLAVLTILITISAIFLPSIAMAWGTGTVLVEGPARQVPGSKIVAVSFGLSFVAVLPSIYGIHHLPERTAVVAVIPLLLGALVIGARSVARFPSSDRKLVLVSVLFAAIGTWQSLSLLPPLKHQRASWVAVERTLAASDPETPVEVPPVFNPFQGVWTLEPDPKWAINRCVAGYYHVASVRTRD